jgi:outer membrane protein
MVDVLTATRNLTQARSNHSQARYDYLINGIKLKQSASNLNLEDLQAINSFLH